ncbi:MAG: ThiF family adenylyltransferase [Candidatus Electrothrix communis]|nr:MAG: ThiF family adenylyltransferase [Candidatus Electrothrix communis]
MAKFVVNNVLDTEDNPFDRQERITWWDQEKIRQAKVMVVGAGAIGNETLKNLALLGFRNIFIVDFDTVSTSNLSRTVLFRKSDKDKKKAEVAAERTKELCLSDDVNINWFHGDIVWELGTGVYREMDIVLGCLDNVETRFAVNRQCYLAGTPWIDSGIYELGVRLSVFIPPNPPCYECNATEEQIKASRQRYSCDDFKKTQLQEGKIPTVQIASAIVSALQVQEAIKLICGQEATVGKKIYFQGKNNDYDILDLPTNPDCMGHTVSYPEIIPLPLSSTITVKEFLQYVSEKHHDGNEITLDFSGDRTFVVSIGCRACGKLIKKYKPSFRICDTETICWSCQQQGVNFEALDTGAETEKRTVGKFNLSETEDIILNMTLKDIGVPCCHVVAVIDKEKKYRYYELTNDNVLVFFGIYEEIELVFMHPTDGKLLPFTVNTTMTAREVIAKLIGNGFIQPNSHGYQLVVKGGAELRQDRPFSHLKVKQKSIIRVLPTISAGGCIISTYEIVQFLTWINQRHPKMNLISTIPFERLYQLINEFCSEHYMEYARDTFIKEIQRHFYEPSFVEKFHDAVNMLVKGKRVKKNFIDLLERYKSIPFHGMFIFPLAEKRWSAFVEKYWEDLNSATREWLDIYYSEKDIKYRSGHDILSFFHQVDSTNITIPCLLIWQENLKNAVSFQLRLLSEEQIYDIIQFVVQLIRKKCGLSEIYDAVIQKYNPTHSGLVAHEDMVLNKNKNSIASQYNITQISYVEKVNQLTNIGNLKNGIFKT